MKLNPALILSWIALIFGLLSGPWVLESAQNSQPSIAWSEIPYLFIGSAVSVFAVVGIQVAIGKQRAARFASWFFGLSGIYFASSGISAFVAALLGAGVDASAVLFLSVGTGAIVGALLAGAAHRAKFAT